VFERIQFRLQLAYFLFECEFVHIGHR
jgi:hypothetical protein